MEIFWGYFNDYGVLFVFYFDRYSIFRVNNLEWEGELIQFICVIKILGIELIYVNSLQVKGWVECVNQILQDRLVKEMWFQNISDIEIVNVWLLIFIEVYNNWFVMLFCIIDNVYFDVYYFEEELGYIFSLQVKCVLFKNFIFQYKSSVFQVCSEGWGY